MVADIFHSGASILCWMRVFVALQATCGLQLDVSKTDSSKLDNLMTSLSQDASAMATSQASEFSHLLPQTGPCLLDDIFAELEEGLGDDGTLTNSILTLFGICAATRDSLSLVLLELAKAKSTNGEKVLLPTGALLFESEGGELTLEFDLPQSPFFQLKPTLLLMFESPVTEGDLDNITFTGPSLKPSTQVVCISEGTQYILLTGKTSDGSFQQKWRISVEANPFHMKTSVKELLIGGKSKMSITPFLLFSGGGGSDTRNTGAPGSSETLHFLCELRRFLCDVLSQEQSDSPPLKLDSLQSLPPLTLGLSSSEILLAGLLNSPAPTIFYFTSSTFHVHPGKLSMSPALLEEVRQRLEKTVVRVLEILRAEDNHGVKRLERLRELATLPVAELPSGEIQYQAFLLLMALKTVSREIQKQMRATRAEPSSPAGSDVCGLRSLTVSLEKHLVGPNTANINNCRGSCTFPMVNTKNHAVLLDSHIQSGNVQERGPCCIPVAYEALEVVNLNEHGTYFSIQPDMVATECGCR